MMTIEPLKNHPEAIPRLAEIWHEVLGKIWMPEIGIEKSESLYYEELKQDMPLTYVALYGAIPVGSCTLEFDGHIRPELGPWIGDLVVDPKYQKQGIGKRLLDITKAKAREMGYSKLYLFTFDPTVADYYIRLGWTHIGMDEFKGHPVTVMGITL